MNNQFLSPKEFKGVAENFAKQIFCDVYAYQSSERLEQKINPADLPSNQDVSNWLINVGRRNNTNKLTVVIYQKGTRSYKSFDKITTKHVDIMADEEDLIEEDESTLNGTSEPDPETAILKATLYATDDPVEAIGNKHLQSSPEAVRIYVYMLKKKLTDAQKIADKVPGLEAEIERLQDEIETMEKDYDEAHKFTLNGIMETVENNEYAQKVVDKGLDLFEKFINKSGGPQSAPPAQSNAGLAGANGEVAGNVAQAIIQANISPDHAHNIYMIVSSLVYSEHNTNVVFNNLNK